MTKTTNYEILMQFEPNSHMLYLTLILLRLFDQHYRHNSNLLSFQASLCTLTATHLSLINVCTYNKLNVHRTFGQLLKCTVKLLNEVGRNDIQTSIAAITLSLSPKLFKIRYVI